MLLFWLFYLTVTPLVDEDKAFKATEIQTFDNSSLLMCVHVKYSSANKQNKMTSVATFAIFMFIWMLEKSSLERISELLWSGLYVFLFAVKQ